MVGSVKNRKKSNLSWLSCCWMRLGSPPLWPTRRLSPAWPDNGYQWGPPRSSSLCKERAAILWKFAKNAVGSVFSPQRLTMHGQPLAPFDTVESHGFQCKLLLLHQLSALSFSLLRRICGVRASESVWLRSLSLTQSLGLRRSIV